jgi:tetratricopeptide (TPR) repeat protein
MAGSLSRRPVIVTLSMLLCLATLTLSPVAGQQAEVSVPPVPVAVPVTAPAPAAAAAMRQVAMDLAYNLDRPQAIAFLEEAVRVEPDHPANHRLLATLAWLRLLWERGAVTVDDYLGKLATKDVDLGPAAAARTQAAAALAAGYTRHLAQARALAERWLARSPDDPAALYEMGAVYGLETSYHASIEGRMLKSFGTARKAYAAQARALARDPRRYDAGYYVGSYRCLVSELPAATRWLAILGGLRGNKREGLALLEAAARHPGEAQGQARYTLVLFYNRDGRFAEALRILEEIRTRYPRNRQFLYETASTWLRAGDPARALALLNEGVERLRTDDRPRWYGEAALWHYKRGVALRQLHRTTEARHDLDTAQTFDASPWIKARIRDELVTLQTNQAGDSAPR